MAASHTRCTSTSGYTLPATLAAHCTVSFRQEGLSASAGSVTALGGCCGAGSELAAPPSPLPTAAAAAAASSAGAGAAPLAGSGCSSRWRLPASDAAGPRSCGSADNQRAGRGRGCHGCLASSRRWGNRVRGGSAKGRLPGRPAKANGVMLAHTAAPGATPERRVWRRCRPCLPPLGCRRRAVHPLGTSNHASGAARKPRPASGAPRWAACGRGAGRQVAANWRPALASARTASLPAGRWASRAGG